MKTTQAFIKGNKLIKCEIIGERKFLTVIEEEVVKDLGILLKGKKISITIE